MLGALQQPQQSGNGPGLLCLQMVDGQTVSPNGTIRVVTFNKAHKELTGKMIWLNYQDSMRSTPGRDHKVIAMYLTNL